MLVALAAGIGFATPPVGACVRTLLRDPRAFAVEASAVELTWVFGPPLALGAGALFSTGAALAGAGAVLLAGDRWRSPRTPPRAPGARRASGASARRLAAQPRRCGRSRSSCSRSASSSARSRSASRRPASALGATAAAGPLLGVWGVGSLLGGLLAARAAGRNGRADGAQSGGDEERGTARRRALAAPVRAVIAPLRSLAAPPAPSSRRCAPLRARPRRCAPSRACPRS